MFKKLLLLFILVPLIELLIILKVGELIGFWPTLISIIGISVLGAYLAKKQGLYVIRKVQEQLSMGIMPGNELVDGLIILIAALLLLTPGLLTDFVGIIMLLPFNRHLFREYIKRLLNRWINNGTVFINYRR